MSITLVGYRFANYYKIKGSTKYQLKYNTSFPFDLKYDNKTTRLFLFEQDNMITKDQIWHHPKAEYILKTCHKKELKEMLKLRKNGIKL